jgi:hypothetical protein
LQLRKKSGANPLLEKVEQKFYPIIFHFLQVRIKFEKYCANVSARHCNVVKDGFAPLFPKVDVE